MLELTGSAPDALEAHLGVPSADADPLGLLADAGLGWLVEHVDFLREPLDWLAGHGDRFEDAVATGIARAAQTLRHVSGAWVKEQKVEASEGKMTAWSVTLEVSFILE